MENDLPIVAQDGLKITPDDAIRLFLALIGELEKKNRILESRIKEVAQEYNKLVSIIEQLAKVSGLEYSQDVKEWVSTEKLKELKETPR